MPPRRGDPGPQPQPRSPPGAEGAVAWLIRHDGRAGGGGEGGWGRWGRQRWPAGRCRTALRAAQLRLALGFFQAERLTACCPLELDADVSETVAAVAACIRVRALTPKVPWVVVLGV